jgi:LmbE family N-acetylglucosaminyl deacetylase
MSEASQAATSADQSPPLEAPRRHLFVSPHYDDIALSCGGTVARLTHAGRAAAIAVVFGDEPDPARPLSPFAVSMHEGWGLDAEQVIARRRAEEAAAAAVLGATSSVLPFHDAIYRGRHYESDEQLFGRVAAAEAELTGRIMASLGLGEATDAAVRVYAPLGVGNHVDHQHGFAVGVALAGAGWAVWFYEDQPYALNEGALDRRLAALAATPVEPAAVIDVGSTWETKLDAILAYQSQLATVFRYVGAGSSRPEIDARMREDAERIGNGVPAERFWRLHAG